MIHGANRTTVLRLQLHSITNIETSITQFNSVITNADRAHIPQGNRKHYNPNFTPEIGRLIKERDRLKFNSTLPLTNDITTRLQYINTGDDCLNRLQYLNNDISDRIYDQKTQNWRSLTTLNHKTGTSELYKTLKSITQSNTGITTSRATIGASNSIPTYKAQENILIQLAFRQTHN